jgi:hypothetical protein
VTTSKSDRIETRGKIVWLRAELIALTPQSWGRPLRMADVRLIAAEFDPDRFGVLAIWRRPDSSYCTIDGQHRLAAVLNVLGWSDQSVPCIVFDGLTEREAAELSLGLQERRNLHGYDRHRASLMAGHKRATAIQAACDEVGVEIARSHARAFQTCALDGLGHVWDRLGYGGLVHVLRILVNAWNGRENTITARTLPLVGMLLCQYPTIDDVRLSRTLSRYSAEDWVASCRAVPGRTLAHVASDVVSAYNSRLAPDHKLAETLPSKLVQAYKRSPVFASRGKTKTQPANAQSGTHVVPASRRRK